MIRPDLASWFVLPAPESFRVASVVRVLRGGALGCKFINSLVANSVALVVVAPVVGRFLSVLPAPASASTPPPSSVSATEPVLRIVRTGVTSVGPGVVIGLPIVPGLIMPSKSFIGNILPIVAGLVKFALICGLCLIVRRSVVVEPVGGGALGWGKLPGSRLEVLALLGTVILGILLSLVGLGLLEIWHHAASSSSTVPSKSI